MDLMRDSFLTKYLHYVGETEAPIFYHRWAAISMVGAFLGRQYSLSLGHFELYTNMYIMLIGEPGARKSTAVKIAKKIITSAGYDKISADKSSKEKFMLDLSGMDGSDPDSNSSKQSIDAILDEQLWGDLNTKEPAEVYIACDEFNDFIGLGNLEFISLLGNFWDYNGVFKNRIKSGKSVEIHDPTVSILGGNTPTSFSNAFPADTLGQGFFSRLLLVFSEPTGKLITFPTKASTEDTSAIVSALQRIKIQVTGKATLTEEAQYLLDRIYRSSKPMDDVRFISYSSRRFTHLLKLCLIISACYYSSTIEVWHVIEANTLLTHTENFMPKALGSFGKARNSDVTHKLVAVLSNATRPMSMKDLWTHFISDMDKVEDLANQIRNLQLADMIQIIDGKFLGKKKIVEQTDSEMLDWSYLTKEERESRL